MTRGDSRVRTGGDSRVRTGGHSRVGTGGDSRVGTGGEHMEPGVRDIGRVRKRRVSRNRFFNTFK